MNAGCYSCKYIKKSMYDRCEHPKNTQIEHGYAYDFNFYVEVPEELNMFRNCPNFEEKIKIKKWWKK